MVEIGTDRQITRPQQLEPGPQVGSGADGPGLVIRPPRATNQTNALIHLYRAEMGRLTAYRKRLDITTSWTVTTATIITTFGLTNPQVPQAAFLFVMFAVFFFLHLEARRYRAYEASRHKVLLLERYFYPETLGYAVEPKWLDYLIEALQNPHRQLNYLGALGWRLRRNYLWIFAAVLFIWLGKLHLKGEPTFELDELVARAALGAIPGWFTFALVGVFYACLVAVAIRAHRVYPLGDEEARELLKATPAD